jgi:60 kDa SS-A/Ro ribonucleoprotein
MGNKLNNLPITCREGSVAMSMVTAKTENDYVVRGFTGHMHPLDVSPRRRMDDIIKSVSGLPFGYTDCALPMLDAINRGEEYDAFVIYTDNETYYGDTHPNQALKLYRQKFGIPAKLVVVGMVSTEFTIADPEDGGQLDVVGFDTATPNILSHFISQ